tara:strand:- start:13523 stop:15010 length:1488 start_codon:yes stop_codon:yes gene_type:complete
MTFDQLGLSVEILRAIKDRGYLNPTPIQAQAIPEIINGKDIMGGAQTGTGKTASFTLPMLRRLQPYANTSVSPARHPIRCLILIPTRELAAQLFENVKTYGNYLPLKCTVVYGGVNMDSQIKELRSGVEILVATPGRLLDHIRQKTLRLSQVEILILDEADRMLDMGFLPDIKRILTLLPQKRQSLMFSATFSKEIKKLANNILKKPILIEVAKCNSISNLVTHVVHPVDQERKQELLTYLIKSQNLRQVLVFVRTKNSADNLTHQLKKDGILATAIHGDRSQLQRTQALEEFKHGRVCALVATDIAARGLDIEDLPHVINFELPNTPEDYIHRIGRTGRAGTKGWATSLVCDSENEILEEIEKLIKTKITKKVITLFRSKKEINLKIYKNKRRGYNQEKDDLNIQTKNKKRLGISSKNKEYTKVKKSKEKKDPLFSHPYVPAKNSSKKIKSLSDSMAISTLSTTTNESNSFYLNKRKKETIPALFMPSPISTTK